MQTLREDLDVIRDDLKDIRGDIKELSKRMDRFWLHVVEVKEYLDGIERYRDGGDEQERCGGYYQRRRCEELREWAREIRRRMEEREREVGLAREGAGGGWGG